MENFIIKPNLPQNDVTLCAVSCEATDVINELNELGITCLKIAKNHELVDEISTHADIELLHLENNKFYVSDKQVDLINELTEKGSNVTKIVNISSPYPNDILLNKLIINDKIIGKFEIKDKHFSKYNIFNVKQGYTKCSTLAVDEKSFITDDFGIASLLKNCQFDVLLIDKGDISLSGNSNHYGFIGGATCKIGKDKIYFNGNIETHRNFNDIKSFLNSRNIEMIYNINRNLSDFGGMVSIKERVL